MAGYRCRDPDRRAPRFISRVRLQYLEEEKPMAVRDLRNILSRNCVRERLGAAANAFESPTGEGLATKIGESSG